MVTLTGNEASLLSALGTAAGKHCFVSQHGARSAVLSYPPISRACNQARIVPWCVTALALDAIADYTEATGIVVLATTMASRNGQGCCCHFLGC